MTTARIKTIVSDAELIFVALKDGAIECSAIVFDCDERVDPLAESCAQLALRPELRCENDEVLSMRFKPYALLDYLVDGHSLCGDRKLLDKAAKPCIDQLRKELQSMIDEIDGLAYADE